MPIKPVLNERELLSRIAKGDEHAFGVVFQGYYHALGEFVYKLTESKAVTEELVQDVFIKVWLNRVDLPKIRNFSNYIFILCRNQAYNELKRIANERNFKQDFSIEQQISEKESHEVSPEITYRSLLNEAVEQLSPQAQLVYLMSRDERLKHQEIADKLMISTETVKKHIQYANRFITDYIRNHSDLAIAIILMSQICVH